MRSRTAGVMTTLMRNGRDRRSENPLWADAIVERVFVVGTDQRITSGPAATAAASQRGKPRRENRPYTWLHPNASQKSQICSCNAGTVHTWPEAAVRCSAAVRPVSGPKRKSLERAQTVENDPNRKSRLSDR